MTNRYPGAVQRLYNAPTPYDDRKDMHIYLKGIFCALTYSAIAIWLASGSYSHSRASDTYGCNSDPVYSFSEHKPSEPQGGDVDSVILFSVFLDAGKQSGYCPLTSTVSFDSRFTLPSVRAPPSAFFAL